MARLIAPVLALKFITTSRAGVSPEKYLFAAIGNQVQVFIGKADKPSTIEEVFPTEYRIHGFSDVVSNRMIIYGGRIVALVRIDFIANDVRIALQEITEFDDWVWGVHWLSHGRMVAVACGHSATYICDAGNLERSFVLQSEEKELTWSAKLFTNPHGLRVVAGSSFGDVLSWTLLDTVQLELAETHLLSKHDESNPLNDKLLPVHRLCAHDGPVMRLTISQDANRMATASVDRTVRVWAIRKSDCSACRGGCFTPLILHYGHLARVWDVSFINDCNVVSVGEDHSCRVWGEIPGMEIACYHGHAGRNIWSVSVCDGLVATGGEDGGVKVRSLGPAVTMGPFHLPRFENPRKKGCFKESCRSIVVVDCETLLVSTDFGRILRGQVDTGITWTEVFRDDNGTAFTPWSLVVCGGFVVAGQSDGNVAVLRGDCKIGDLEGEGMVMGLFANVIGDGCDVLIAFANGVLSHWRVADEMLYLGNYRMQRTVKTSLVTAACIARDKGLVIAGDRGGRVLTYHLLTHGFDRAVHPVCMIRPHKDRVSGVVYSARGVHTSGFDGAVVTLDITATGIVDVRCVDRAPDRFDTITKYEGGKVLAFRGSQGVLWGLEDRIEYLRGDIGNWRRAHDVNMKECIMGYWRGGAMYITRGNHEVWGSCGGHGGRVSALGTVGHGVVSVGEDGVCIWSDNDVVQRLSGHTSFVHDVAVLDDVIVSVGGKDEVMVWEHVDGVWRRRWSCVVGELIGGGGVAERCLSVCFDEDIVVGRSDGSIVRIVDGVGEIARRVGGGVLCIDCCKDGIGMVAGDTSGVVTVFDNNDTLRELKLHQGGVNDIKIFNKYSFISAGDDASVKFCRDGGVVWSHVIHTAAVTGLTVADHVIYSVGADQRIIKWTKEGEHEMSTTGIVDASSIISHSSGRVIIGGIGIQCFIPPP